MSESSSNSRHPTVSVEVGNRKEEIDEMIAPLVRELWVAGLSTAMSCQEEFRETAWIEFFVVEDLEKFINIVAEYDVSSHSMYARISGTACTLAGVKSWSYSLSPIELGNDRGEQDHIVNFGFTANVYIPHADIPTLVERLVAYNRRSEPHDEVDVSSAAELASAMAE
jgi:hypothetical protein